MSKVVAGATVALVLGCWVVAGQEREDRTLVSWAQLRDIINEVSGERALHNVVEIVPYPRVRHAAEYAGHFRETEVVARLAREYGFSNVEIETFPSPGPSWQVSRGELWIVGPEVRKLYDAQDVVLSVNAGSTPGDVTAEVVDVGLGSRPEDYAGRGVQGKIVLGSAPSGVLQRLGVVERGAAGVLSYNTVRPDDGPDEVLWQRISPKGGFGWSIAPRVGRGLAARLGGGEKLILRSVIEAESFPGEMELVHAVIPGDATGNGDVMISAHVFESYEKQGANDDASGCGVTLEMGRSLLRLVADGKLPRPGRTLHFTWVEEISGTRAWLAKHADIRKRLIADLTFDQVGLALRANASTLALHRTPDTLPSFLNDLCASVLEFVADTNRERLRYRHNGPHFSMPVVASTGSRDPFYARVERSYTSSDHYPYQRAGVPAVLFVNWPDRSWHSSLDRSDSGILDATQLKRAAVVGTAAMSVLATTGEELAASITAEALARGAERMAQAERRGMAYLADATSGSALLVAYAEAVNAVRHQTAVEKAVLRSTAGLRAAPAETEKTLTVFEILVDERGAAFQRELDAFCRLRAQQLHVGAPTGRRPVTAAEEQAARLVPSRVGSQAAGRPNAGGGGQVALPESLSAQERAARQVALRKVPQHMAPELDVLLERQMTVLEIRDFLSGEFEPLPLADLLENLRAQEKLGTLKLAEKR